MSPSGCIQISQGTKVCIGRTLENVTFDLQCYSLPRFSGGSVGNQVEFGLESINTVCGLCVYMYVSPKTSKTKLLLIHPHPYSFHLKKKSLHMYSRSFPPPLFCFPPAESSNTLSASCPQSSLRQNPGPTAPAAPQTPSPALCL